jgi:hypothetical protein
MYGENFGTSSLARNLIQLSEQVYSGIDNGYPTSEYIDSAQSLMEGAMVLWRELVQWEAEERR